LDDPSRRRFPAQNGSSYSHLPAELRAQLDALPPLPYSIQRRQQQSTFTSSELRTQFNALPPLPHPVQRPRHANQIVSENNPMPQTPAQLHAQLAALQVNYLFYICKFV
jgi:hypothetical protein